jgi:hypothetical protein
MANDTDSVFNVFTSLSLDNGFSPDPALHSQVSDLITQDNLHSSGILDSTQHYGVEAFSLSAGFDDTGAFDNNQADYSLPDSINPHYPQSDNHQNLGHGDSSLHSDRSYEIGNSGQQESHSFSTASQHQIKQCFSSSSNCPYITITSDGLPNPHIYKHTSDNSSSLVGEIYGRTIYDSTGHNLGYAGTDGKVYDHYDHCVGWVNGCHVYNTSGVEVYETTKGVIGAAAYLLCVYYGGAN